MAPATRMSLDRRNLPTIDPYKILQVNVGASRSQINSAYEKVRSDMHTALSESENIRDEEFEKAQYILAVTSDAHHILADPRGRYGGIQERGLGDILDMCIAYRTEYQYRDTPWKFLGLLSTATREEIEEAHQFQIDFWWQYRGIASLVSLCIDAARDAMLRGLQPRQPALSDVNVVARTGPPSTRIEVPAPQNGHKPLPAISGALLGPLCVVHTPVTGAALLQNEVGPEPRRWQEKGKRRQDNLAAQSQTSIEDSPLQHHTGPEVKRQKLLTTPPEPETNNKNPSHPRLDPKPSMPSTSEVAGTRRQSHMEWSKDLNGDCPLAYSGAISMPARHQSSSVPLQVIHREASNTPRLKPKASDVPVSRASDERHSVV